MNQPIPHPVDHLHREVDRHYLHREGRQALLQVITGRAPECFSRPPAGHDRKIRGTAERHECSQISDTVIPVRRGTLAS